MKKQKKQEERVEKVGEKPEKLVKYDLACGDRKQEGFLGVEIAKTKSADVVANILEFPWKFAKDNSVDELYTAHFIEHIPMCYWNKGNEYTIVHKDASSVELFEKFMAECHRVLKPGGKLTIVAPYYSSMRCWQDPTHRRAISDATFFYFDRNWRKTNLLEHCHADVDFEFAGGYNINANWASRNQEAQQFAFKHHMNSIDDIIVTLTKRV